MSRLSEAAPEPDPLVQEIHDLRAEYVAAGLALRDANLRIAEAHARAHKLGIEL